MYLSHFGFQEKPFKTGPDPAFLWLGAKHRDALATLVNCILDAKGFTVVTGDVGAGKTTFVNALLGELKDRAVAAKVTCSDVGGVDFLKLISKAYSFGGGIQSKEAFHDQFSTFFRNAVAMGKKVVLIIDEAQRLAPANLAELSQLSDIRENGARLLSIVFVGENAFAGPLRDEAIRALGQQPTFSYAMEPLTRDETAQYVAYRLNTAHCTRELFTPEAIEEIFSFSRGVPRLINMVCDLSLSRTFFKGEDTVRPETVRECAKMLRVPEEKAAPARDRAAQAKDREATAASEPDEKILGDVRAMIVEKRAPKPHSVRAAYAAVIVFLLVAVGFALFLMSGSQPDTTKVEATKEAASVSRAAEEAAAPSAQTAQGSEPSALQKSPGVSGEDGALKGERTGGVRDKKRETVGSRTAAGKARQASMERSRRGAPGSEAATGDTGRGTSADSGETVAREPARQGPGEVESGAVIDMLIKKRSEQK
ncbi:MAG TPA: AAA family ATPase [Syntrophales bacterium]|nr:AAA family ATPase [Syntrophales bacterium]